MVKLKLSSCQTPSLFLKILYHPHILSSFIIAAGYTSRFLPGGVEGEQSHHQYHQFGRFFWRFSERFFHLSIIQRKCCRFVQKIVIYLLKAREGDKGRSENLWKFIQFDEEKLKSFSTRWKNWDMCCLIGRDVTRSWRLAERSEQLVSFTKECL